MKKLLLLPALLMQANLFSQSVPNAGFEGWNSFPYENPTNWSSANSRDVSRIGSATITKVTGFSGFGLRVQTIVSAPDTSESYVHNMSTDPCSDPSQWKGGVPYSQQPTALTGYYRYNTGTSDTAIMLVIFRKNGLHIGDNLIKVKGNQSSWTPFSYTVSCAGVPDTMIFAAASSNKISNVGVQNGSFLELDNLGFAGTTQPFPGGTLENWTSFTFEKLNGWSIGDAGVTKSTSSYSGTYAMRLETMGNTCGGGGVQPGSATTGKMTNSGPKGGYPYTSTIDTLCGYYKYTSMGNDTANIFINLSKNASNVGGNMKKLPASANYTYFQIPFSAFMTPDTIRVDITSSGWPNSTANTGSVLYVDNLYLKSQPLGVKEITSSPVSFNLYPNPVKDKLALRFNDASAEGVKTITIYNSLGQCRGSWTVTESSLLIDVKEFAADVYFVKMNTEKGSFTKKFIKE